MSSGARSAAAVDIGLLGYRTGVEIVDLGGLTDPRIGTLPGRHLHKPIEPGYVVGERAPDVIVIRISSPPLAAADGGARYTAISGVEQILLADPGFGSGYRVEFVLVPSNPARRPYYGKVVLVRTDFEPAAEPSLSGQLIRIEP